MLKNDNIAVRFKTDFRFSQSTRVPYLNHDENSRLERLTDRCRNMNKKPPKAIVISSVRPNSLNSVAVATLADNIYKP